MGHGHSWSIPTYDRTAKVFAMAVDYFTKWVEAEPLAQITKAKVENFVRNHIIFHFEIPKVIITDNGW